MFTNTFKPHVLTQLQMRRVHNSKGLAFLLGASSLNIIPELNDSVKALPYVSNKSQDYYTGWGQQWATRYPFVYAYSNVRYFDAGKKTYNKQWLKYGVLSSALKVNQPENDAFSVVGRSIGIYDFYENMDLSGVKPRPIIQNFNIEALNATMTLRTISFTIVCFSYQQFLGIRDYFAIPGTSVFFQYGYLQPSTVGNILLPHLTGNQKEQYGCLLQPNANGQYSKKSNCSTECCTGVVTGYDIDQTDNKFTITVKMMTEGSSQILVMVRQSVASEIKNAKEQELPESTFVTQIRSLAENYKDLWKKEVISVPTSKGDKTYVTFGWAINIILQQIRSQSYLFNYDSTYKQKRLTGDTLQTTILPGNPVGKFVAPMVLPTGLRSIDQNIIIYDSTIDKLPNDGSGVPYRSIYMDKDYYTTLDKDTVHSPINIMKNVYLNSEVRAIIQRQTGINYTENEDEIFKVNFQNWLDHYDTFPKLSTDTNVSSLDRILGSIPSQSTGKLVFLGNIYIKLERILEYLIGVQQISMLEFVNELLLLVSSATGLTIQCHSAQDRGEILIAQKSLFYTTPEMFYRVPNFGEDSIVKTIEYKVAMPDWMNAGIISAYGDRTGLKDGTIQNIFKSLFGHRRESMLDLHQFKKHNVTTEYFTATQTPPAQLNSTTNKKTSPTYQQINTAIYQPKKDKRGNTIKTAGMQYKTELFADSDITSVLLKHNLDLLSAEKQLLSTTHNISMYEYSMYSITVQLTLDFIGGISFGEMFKLAFNPLGWQAAFVVTAVSHTVSQRGAQTKIRGIMFGVSVL